MILFSLIFLGVAVGIISAFFGVGGGIIIVPTLYALFPELPPQSVIGCSLGVIFINSILNTYKFYRSGKRANLKLVAVLSIGMLIGVFFGNQLTEILPAKTLKLIFGIVILLIAMKTFFTKNLGSNKETWKFSEDKLILFKILILSIFGGITAGLTGLGGGAVLVPILLIIAKSPYNWVSFYSNIAMIFGTFIGVINYLVKTPLDPLLQGSVIGNYQVGYINLAIIGIIFVGANISSGFGVKLSSKIGPVLSRNLFAAMLTIIAIRIFIKY